MICIYSAVGQTYQYFSRPFRAEISVVNQGEEWKKGTALCLMGTWISRALEIAWEFVDRISVGKDRLVTFIDEQKMHETGFRGGQDITVHEWE